ncbi:MAG: hypothetical protein M3Q40_09315 [Pseudomonadota bacterium]|nr:hypothetical protein [Pseudomonadota bacterium]
MHLIQIFLPVRDNDGQPYPQPLLDQVREELTVKFGGSTAFLRSPAVGAWDGGSGEVSRDEVILIEVMAEAVDHGWWFRFRSDLQQRFGREEMLIRATTVERL